MTNPSNTQQSNEHPSIGSGSGRSDLDGKLERDAELSNKRQKLGSASFPTAFSNPLHATDGSQRKQKKHQPKTTDFPQQKRKKRKICDRCHRPVPQTCLCESLPATPIALVTTEVVVLQHPLELKNHKAASHRSLPLLELCLDSSSLVLRTGRRFGKESLGVEILSKLWGKNGDETISSPSAISYLPVLVFPKINVESTLEASVTMKQTEVRNSKSANTRIQNSTHQQSPPMRYCEDESAVLSLSELKERWKCETNTSHPKNMDTPNLSAASNTNTTPTANKKKILLLVLDATWKHAREMHLANIKADQYPPHMLRLALQPEDFAGGFVSGRFRLRGKASKTGYKRQQLSNRIRNGGDRNEEKAPEIDETWMSTAECIAWILSNLEESNQQILSEATSTDSGTNSIDSSSPSLYEILMKPLDAMVAKWNSYRNQSNNSNRNKTKSKCERPAP